MDKPNTDSGLSYKFQRLREKIREAITTGELSGKLPGERALAKRFHANAKTLSKALTDLAAEGLLDRSIGRGTFVKGTIPPATDDKRWLVLCDPDQISSDTVQALRQIHKNIEITTDLSTVRPSFINQFSAVIDVSNSNNDAVIRDLVVRNIPVVLVGPKPHRYSTHAVQYDYPLAVSMAGRDLMLAGHVHLAAVEPKSSASVVATLRATAARYAPNAVVDACFPKDVPAMIQNGVTAFVCGSASDAIAVKEQFERLGIAVPHKVSLMAVGSAGNEPPCSGYFIGHEEHIAAIEQLLADVNAFRPTTIWLSGRFVDCNTVGPVSGSTTEHPLQFHDMTA